MKKWIYALTAVLLAGIPVTVSADHSVYQHVAGESEEPEPPAFVPRLDSIVRLGSTSAFEVDREATVFEPGLTLQNRFRVGLGFDSGIVWDFFKLKMDYEHEWMSGVLYGGETDLEGDFFPGDEGVEQNRLRKLWAQASLGYFLTLGGGVTTSDWGLGLLANSGSREWTSGSAYFGASRGGDVVLRAMAATGPYTSEKLTVFFGVDQVETDDALIDDDEAKQWVAGVKVGTGETYQAGVYVVSREQETSEQEVTEAMVFDTYATYKTDVGDNLVLEAQAEGALIQGKTDLGPTPNFAEHDVLQLAAATRLSLAGHQLGTVIDFLYASGDANPDDEGVNNFRVDVNYEMGMMLYRTILAAQSARTSHFASDLDLVGVPSDDLERVATRGAITNTIAVFPRLWYRPISGLEFYGGPLLAFAEVPPIEGFNSRIAGGQKRNALRGVPGKFYGTEIDLGARWTGLFWGTTVQLGAEGGVFLPGSAFNATADTTMDMVTAWRVVSAIRF